MNYRSTTIRILSKHFNLPCEVMICIWQQCTPYAKLALANAITYIQKPCIHIWYATKDLIRHGHLASLRWFYGYLHTKPASSCATIAITHDQAHIIEWLLAHDIIVPSDIWYDMAKRYNAQKCIALFDTMTDEFVDDDISSS